VSLEAVLRHYQVFGLRRHQDQLQGRCPFHQGHRDDSFRAHLARNIFQCFACQAHGNVLDFVAAMEKCSIREAALRLQQWFGGMAPAAAPRTRLHGAAADRQKGELVREKGARNVALSFALTGVDSNAPYLAQRGIAPATASAFGVGLYAGPGLMRGRIVIPICNAGGQLVAYAGRAPDGQPPKYKLPAGFRKGLELFNQQRAAVTGSKTMILVEGYFDCMRVHQAGFPRVVALMGSTLSVAQESTLLRHYDQIVLMLDGDAAGRAGQPGDHHPALRPVLGRSGPGAGWLPTGSVIEFRDPAAFAIADCRNEAAVVKQKLAVSRNL
jgi:DNA primase